MNRAHLLRSSGEFQVFCRFFLSGSWCAYNACGLLEGGQVRFAGGAGQVHGRQEFATRFSCHTWMFWCTDYLTPSSSHWTKFKQFFNNYELNQLITCPTRITKHSSTCIEHVWTNQPSMYTNLGTIEVNLSDHLLLFESLRKFPKVINIFGLVLFETLTKKLLITILNINHGIYWKYF